MVGTIESGTDRQFEQDTPGQRRRYVLSICEVARRELARRGITFDDVAIAEYLIMKKKETAGWIIMERDATKLREDELRMKIRELFGEGPFTPSNFRKAVLEIDKKYQEIDADSRRNYSFLDLIIFGNGGNSMEGIREIPGQG